MDLEPFNDNTTCYLITSLHMCVSVQDGCFSVLCVRGGPSGQNHLQSAELQSAEVKQLQTSAIYWILCQNVKLLFIVWRKKLLNVSGVYHSQEKCITSVLKLRFTDVEMLIIPEFSTWNYWTKSSWFDERRVSLQDLIQHSTWFWRWMEETSSACRHCSFSRKSTF